MEKIGIFVSVYGAREVFEVLKMYSSLNYSPRFYVVSKQNNPMVKRVVDATNGFMMVDPSLSMDSHISVIEKFKDDLDLIVCTHEKPIINGLRDEIEKRKLKFHITFPKSIFALERSKILQRKLFPEDYNPLWKAFYPNNYSSEVELFNDVKNWVENLGGAENVVFKPDAPAAGKGVAVGGEHFHTLEELLLNYISGFNMPFIIERREEVEESSCQIWFDGNIDHLSFLRYPEVRDYKRAFEDDKGPNTGGMGCYMDSNYKLPFMLDEDFEAGYELARRTIKNVEKWAEENGFDTSGMKPCMYYLAMAHPHKVFEGNVGRPGDPEDIPPLLSMKNDLIEFYLHLCEGNPEKLEFDLKATVLVYVVPPSYGGKSNVTPSIILDLPELFNTSLYGDRLMIPGDVEVRSDGHIYVRSSRSVAAIGIGECLDEAAEKAHELALYIEDKSIPKGFLWHRSDIGLKNHVEKSVKHRRDLKRRLGL